MLVYILIFSFVLFHTITETSTDRSCLFTCRAGCISMEKKHVYAVVFAFMVILLAGIRWETGTDWEAFYTDFYYLRNADFAEVKSSIYWMTYGRGYVLLTYGFSHLCGNYSVFLLFQAVLITGMTYPVIYKYSKYPSVSFLALFGYSFGYAFAVPRSGISIAVCYLVFDSILEEKNVRAVILAFLAASFHNAALFFLFSIILYRIYLSKAGVIMMFAASAGFSVIARGLLLRAASSWILPVSYSMRIQTYLGNDMDYTLVSSPVRIITRGFVLLLVFLFLWKQRKGNKFVNLIVNMYLVSIAIYLMTMNLPQVFNRLAYYYEDISQFFIFSESLDMARIKNSRNTMIVKIVLIVFFTAKMASRLFMGYSGEIVPYKSIL